MSTIPVTFTVDFAASRWKIAKWSIDVRVKAYVRLGTRAMYSVTAWPMSETALLQYNVHDISRSLLGVKP